jgi:hypothetical protein
MATSVENLSAEAMEKLSAYAVKQQLLKLEEEHNQIEQQVVMLEDASNNDLTISQAHRLRMESVALHRYFLNRKFNVHKGISLSAAIESSLANVSVDFLLLLEELTHFAQGAKLAAVHCDVQPIDCGNERRRQK